MKALDTILTLQNYTLHVWMAAKDFANIYTNYESAKDISDDEQLAFQKMLIENSFKAWREYVGRDISLFEEWRNNINMHDVFDWIMELDESKIPSALNKISVTLTAEWDVENEKARSVDLLLLGIQTKYSFSQQPDVFDEPNPFISFLTWLYGECAEAQCEELVNLFSRLMNLYGSINGYWIDLDYIRNMAKRLMTPTSATQTEQTQERDAISELFTSNKAQVAFKPAIDAGLIDAVTLQPIEKRSDAFLCLLAVAIMRQMGMSNNKWQPFEKLWGIKAGSMRKEFEKQKTRYVIGGEDLIFQAYPNFKR